MLKNAKYVLLISCIIAAIITPSSDIPSMMVVAMSLIALYMAGVGVAFFFGR